MTVSPRILVVAQDPGGAEALAPVVAKLAYQGVYRPFVVLHPMAVKAFSRQGIPVDRVLSWRPREHADDALALLRHIQPRLLLAGTSSGSSLDKLFIWAARGCDIPSMVVLDYWSNYRARFSDEFGPHDPRDDGRQPLTYLPDVVAVIDEYARAEMVKAGFPKESLVVTGNPRFDAVRNLGQRDWSQERKRWAMELQIHAEDLWVSFLSQPPGSLYKSGALNCGDTGLSELSVPAKLLTCLEAGELVEGRKNVFLVRYHPKEDPSLFQSLQRSATIPIRLAQAPQPQELLGISDLVVGMNTVLLVDALLMGRPVVSLQLGLEEKDRFAFGGLDAIRRVYQASQIRAELLNALKSTTALGYDSVPETLVDGHATERVACLVRRTLG